LRRKPTELIEAAGHRDFGDRGSTVRSKQLLARVRKPHAAYPTERCRTQKQVEMRLERSRAHARYIGELFQTDWFGQVAAKPAQRANDISGKSPRILQVALGDAK
jgi:hypothetical protein